MVFAQHFKSIIREIEQVSVYEAYADTSGELLFGRVEKKLENYLLIRVNKQRETFAIIKDYELLPKDNYKKGDRIFFLTKNVLARSNTAQIQGTRTSSEFLKKILAYEIPEVDNKIIEVVSVARNPGVRSKVVVRSNDKAVDPVGACIGVNGNRINSISQELRGEQIDIFKDSDDKQELALRAFQPAKVISIVTTERQVEVHKYQTKPDASKPPETKTITHAYVVLLEEQFSLVLGKRGRNLKMIGNLLGWQIHLVSYQQAMRSETNFP